MPNTSVRQKKFTPTTLILIVLLLGAVFGASRLVTPPPPGPPAEQQKMDPAAQEQHRKTMMETEKREKEQMYATLHKKPPRGITPVADPHTIEVDSSYFLKHKPGEQGIKEEDERIKRQEAEYAAYKKKLAEAEGKSVVPQDKPIPTPVK